MSEPEEMLPGGFEDWSPGDPWDGGVYAAGSESEIAAVLARYIERFGIHVLREDGTIEETTARCIRCGGDGRDHRALGKCERCKGTGAEPESP